MQTSCAISRTSRTPHRTTDDGRWKATRPIRVADPTSNLSKVRTIVAPDQLAELDDWLARRQRSNADLYDHEIGGTYYMAPAPGVPHAAQQARLIVVLTPLAAALGWAVLGPTNLGRLGQEDRNYVVPDVVVSTRLAGAALLDAVVAIEILSPHEDEDVKVAAYRAVVAATGLKLCELWYVDPSEHTLTIRNDRFEQVDRSDVFSLTIDELQALFDL